MPQIWKEASVKQEQEKRTIKLRKVLVILIKRQVIETWTRFVIFAIIINRNVQRRQEDNLKK